MKKLTMQKFINFIINLAAIGFVFAVILVFIGLTFSLLAVLLQIALFIFVVMAILWLIGLRTVEYEQKSSLEAKK